MADAIMRVLVNDLTNHYASGDSFDLDKGEIRLVQQGLDRLVLGLFPGSGDGDFAPEPSELYEIAVKRLAKPE
jgi:hypothetical protein